MTDMHMYYFTNITFVNDTQTYRTLSPILTQIQHVNGGEDKTPTIFYR